MIEEKGFKGVQELLKNINYENLEEKHFIVAIKGIVEILAEKLNDDEQRMKMFNYASKRLENHFKPSDRKYFAPQSDLYLMLVAFETVLTQLNVENEKFHKYVLQETNDRFE